MQGQARSKGKSWYLDVLAMRKRRKRAENGLKIA
jgi:hypothetical protein